MFRTAWIVVFLCVLTWSGINPKDFMTWCLEVAPAVIGGAILWFTRERFPLTPLTYVLILIHCVILMVGGHYTYADVPVGEWLMELTDGTRNNYDKLGHLATQRVGHHEAHMRILGNRVADRRRRVEGVRVVAQVHRLGHRFRRRCGASRHWHIAE